MVVVEGLTVTDPEGPKLPMPSMVTPVVFDALHEMVAAAPCLMTAGEDVNEVNEGLGDSLRASRIAAERAEADRVAVPLPVAPELGWTPQATAEDVPFFTAVPMVVRVPGEVAVVKFD